MNSNIIDKTTFLQRRLMQELSTLPEDDRKAVLLLQAYSIRARQADPNAAQVVINRFNESPDDEADYMGLLQSLVQVILGTAANDAGATV